MLLDTDLFLQWSLISSIVQSTKSIMLKKIRTKLKQAEISF